MVLERRIRVELSKLEKQIRGMQCPEERCVKVAGHYGNHAI